MSKHSAGPWSASDWTNAASPEIAIHSADGQWLADVVVDQDFGDSIDDCNQVANARLMVAAPELLEALSQCITDDGATCAKLGSPRLLARRLYAINQIARAAIAKATGEK